MASPRLLRRRIKSITNTKKITKAMELVAASKMRRAVAGALASRAYADAAWRMVNNVASSTEHDKHPLLRRESLSGKTLLVVYTSDRGLCGGFNAQLLKVVSGFLKTKKSDSVDVIAVGKKGVMALSRFGVRITHSFTDLTNNPRFSDLRSIAHLVIAGFQEGQYDDVHMAYTDFESAMTQHPVIRQLFPFAVQDMSESISSHTFEPSAEVILEEMLPRLVEMQLYQALLESAASEHSARMMAMRSASDSARDMIDAFTLAYNQARQAGITREIAEISGGKAALE